jgi:ATP-dependent phosphofructokinase / diphosphate-dependent phosphofructokinase
MKVGILNGGGDVQPLNAVISSIVKSGTHKGFEFIGFEKGWEGVLSPMLYRTLDMKSVRGISHVGGTILGTVNKGRFAAKVGSGDVNKIPEEILEEAKSNLEKVGIDALIVIGGDGTLTGALQLVEKGVKIVGVPKTIDNDLKSTDKTFGFSTAVDIATEALDRIHTTATSHDRVIFVEVMGRHAGWIALNSGLAGGADMILLPEIPFDYQKIIEFLRKRKETGYRSSVVVVAEGARAKQGLVTTMGGGAMEEVKLGGISNTIIHNIDKMAPGEFELRSTILGHVQRGGSPNSEDRILAKQYGVAAVDAVEKGEFGKMVSLRGDKIENVQIQEAVDQLKLVTEDSLAVQTAKKIGVFFGD